MNKTSIKNFAIWARNKLIADIMYKAGLLGITEKEIKNPLPQSTQNVQFFDIGTKEPYSISGIEIEQRKKLAEEIQRKANNSDYKTAYKNIVEEVAYTWFNRLVDVRFMEVNDYLPTNIRVLSSESSNKSEPDLVTNPILADLDYTPYEKDLIMQLKNDNKLDELFRMLFIKQCNALNAILPELFEKTDDYTESLLNISFTDKDGLVYHLVNDIPEKDFRIKKEEDEEKLKRGEISEEDMPMGQVEIIGWLYQYYNTEPKDETFALLKKNVKITKERIPAATQLFTPDWIVRYMVENSLGRLWIEREQANHPELSEESLSSCFGWKYYLPEAEQEADLQKQLVKIREEYKAIKPEDIKVIDPCMGSGHILVYAFEVLMQIYESYGYSQRDAAKSIITYNLYGLDIDNRSYQLAYFAVIMKARQYNRHILNGEITCHLYAIQESNEINRAQLKYFGHGMSALERNNANNQMEYLLNTMSDSKEYGSIINVNDLDWPLLYRFVGNVLFDGQMAFDTIGLADTQIKLRQLVDIATVLSQKYDVVVTNPPYMGNGGMGTKLDALVKEKYPSEKSDMFACFIVKGFEMAKQLGFVSMITMESWMFLSSFEKMRTKIAGSKSIINLVHMPYLGKGGTSLGINFGTVAVVFFNYKVKHYSSTYDYICYYETDDSGIPFEFPTINERYCVSKMEEFGYLPGKPIAYWINEKMIAAFATGEVLKKKGDTRQGMATSDNNHFLRLWFEVSWLKLGFGCKNSEEAMNVKKKWYPYNKGGQFRKWYGNMDYTINYENNGLEVKKYATELYRTPSRTIKSSSEYFKACLSWSKVTSGSTAFRYFPEGFIFDVAGCCIFFSDDKYMKYIFAFLNSKVCNNILEIISPTMNYEAGHIASLPILYSDNQLDTINAIVTDCIDISKFDWDYFETSWDFARHLLLRGTSNIAEAFEQWQQDSEKRFDKLKANEEKLNQIFIDIYNLRDHLTPLVEDKSMTIRKADLNRDMRSFISYAVGCMFGRYSLDIDGLVYAGGDWDSSKYKTFKPDKDNVLPITDEEYFEDDIVGLFYSFVKKNFGEETLEENLGFIAKALGTKGNSSREIIRNYFLNDFFKDHCKVYQKRPIYWLFDSGKEDGFKALVYMHRYNQDTIGNLRIDYLHKIQRVYESEISRMQETIENSKDAREISAATKRKEKLVRQLKETKEYDEKIAHLALARIAIDLDDGVKINYEKVQTAKDGKKLDILAQI